MYKAIFEVQTITPLFLAGADQGRAELRAPTLRGLMRYWQRALIGGMVGTDAKALAYIQETENATFGSTDRGSAVAIKVSTPSQEAIEFNERTSIRRGERRVATGKGYLLWSMARSGQSERGNLKPARWYFPEDTRFQVVLSARDAVSQQLKQAIATFWLLTQLGGIGSRSRRCAGSINAQAIDTPLPDLPHFPFELAENAFALKQQIEQGIKTAREVSGAVVHSIAEAHFDILAQDACHIWILQDEQAWKSAEGALESIGTRMHAYRSHITIEQRKIFGLPLPRIAPNQRYASPLHLHIAELSTHTYVCIAVLFKTSGHDINMKDDAVIEQWSNEFPVKWEVQW